MHGNAMRVSGPAAELEFKRGGTFVHPEKLQINNPSDMRIQSLSLGDQRYPALVIDNFYRDPDHVRKTALGLHYVSPFSGMHPGYMALLSIPMAPVLTFLYDCYARFYFPSLESFLLKERPWTFMRMEPPGSRPARPVARTPHVDAPLLAGLVYLNTPKQCRGGTALYRHVLSQATAVIHRDTFARRGNHANVDPDTLARMKTLGAPEPYERWKSEGRVQDYDAYWRLIFCTRGEAQGPITGSAGGWEMIELLEMKYNRLVLYPGFLLHSPHYRPEWFGQTPDSYRLTQNFAIEWPEEREA
jgi:hypothetical protein